MLITNQQNQFMILKLLHLKEKLYNCHSNIPFILKKLFTKYFHFIIINYLFYRYKDHVCLIINIASKCTLTEINYKELNQLHDSYADSQGNYN